MNKKHQVKWIIYMIVMMCVGVGMIWFFSNIEQNAQPGITREENAGGSTAVTEVAEVSFTDNGFADTNDYADQEGEDYSLDDYESQAVEEDTEAKEEETKKKSGGRLFYGGKDTGKGSSSRKSTTRKPTSTTTEFDPENHDIDSYYEDNKDEFDSIDDAYDAFEDDEDAWDEY